MRVWVIGRGYPTKENGMMGVFELGQAQMLARYGYEVCYAAFEIGPMRSWKSVGLIKKEENGVQIQAFRLPIGRLSKLNGLRQICDALRNRLFDRLQKAHGIPDIVHIHYPSLFPYSCFAALQKQGTRIVGTEHWSMVLNGTLPAQNLQYLCEFVSRADALACVGAGLREAIIRLTGTGRKITIIPNVVSPAFGKRLTCGKENGKPFRFLAVGRFSKEKGYDKLIRAFALAFKGAEDVRLDFIGGGVCEKEMRRVIEEAHCSQTVTLRGAMKQDELAQRYPEYQALVMPSDYETFGVPAIEAMACGLPVIVTKQAGVSAYIDSCLGFVAENNQPETLAQAMRYLFGAYDRFDPTAISGFAKENFSEDRILSMIEHLYQNAVSRKETV